MEVRQLEIRIIKANDLKDVNLMTKMDVYAVVSISGDQLNNRQQKTAIDKDGGTSPKWDFPTEFTVDDAAVQDNRLTLKIKLLSNRSLGDKEIGVVYIQIKELFDGSFPPHGGGGGGAAGEEEKSGSYSVRLSNGKVMGTLDLAYKFGGKIKLSRHRRRQRRSRVAWWAVDRRFDVGLLRDGNESGGDDRRGGAEFVNAGFLIRLTQ